jgi:hypothetical protein
MKVTGCLSRTTITEERSSSKSTAVPRSQRPQVLTINGRAELAQDAEEYQLLDGAEALEGIRRGLEDVKAGRARWGR